MAGRVSDRTKRRTPCSFAIHGRRQNGFVLDLSRTGLFIQTSADAAPGDRLDIEVVIDDQVLPMHVEVARRKKVPPQLLTVAQGGIGVRILSAPEAYYDALAALKGPNRDGRGGAGPGRRSAGAGPSTARGAAGSAAPTRGTASGRPVATPPQAPPEPDLPRYRVRIAQVHGTRTRSVETGARSEQEARQKVMEDLGEEWKILEVTALSQS